MNKSSTSCLPFCFYQTGSCVLLHTRRTPFRVEILTILTMCTYKFNIDSFALPLLQWKSCKYYKCVSVALVTHHLHLQSTHHAMRMRRIILLSVACPAVQYFPTLPHKGTIFGGKWKLFNNKFVFWFSLQVLLPEIFLIIRTIEWDIVIKTHIGLHVRFLCLLFSWRYNPLWLYFHSPVAVYYGKKCSLPLVKYQATCAHSEPGNFSLLSPPICWRSILLSSHLRLGISCDLYPSR
jgi:hypothetical protein